MHYYYVLVLLWRRCGATSSSIYCYFFCTCWCPCKALRFFVAPGGSSGPLGGSLAFRKHKSMHVFFYVVWYPCGVDVGLLIEQFLVTFWCILMSWKGSEVLRCPWEFLWASRGVIGFPKAENMHFRIVWCSCGVDVGLFIGQFLVTFWSILVSWKGSEVLCYPWGLLWASRGVPEFPKAEKYAFLRCF